MARIVRNAYYGKDKKLYDPSWVSIGDDILRRIRCGELSDELQTLSVADRRMTEEGWRMLELVLPKMTTCFYLDFSRCGISDVAPFLKLLPRLVRVCKCFNFSGNNLTKKSVESLVKAMTTNFMCVRPTWLAIGEDASVEALKFLHDPLLCDPHHKKGCLGHKDHSVVHVVKTMPKIRRRSLGARSCQHMKKVDAFATDTMPPALNWNPEEWPMLVSDEASTTISFTNETGDALTTDNDSFDASELQQAPSGLSIGRNLFAYVKQEHITRQIELASSWARFAKFDMSQLAAAAHLSRRQVHASLKNLHKLCGDNWTCFLIKERLYILGTDEERKLTLIDLTQSIQQGAIVDFQGTTRDEAIPIQNFNYLVEADVHVSVDGQHELCTIESEQLTICLDDAESLLEGWVAARTMDRTEYLWFPLHKCRFHA